MPAQIELTKTVREDVRVTKLQAEGWRFHSNFDPRIPGDLEAVLEVSDSLYYHPKNAGQILIFNAAYNMAGSPIPAYKAVYLRDFKKLE